MRRPHIDWRAKALLQSALSLLPGGAKANYALQRATGGLPLSDAKLRETASIASHHFEAVRTFGAIDPAEARFFEFGAGWDFHVPLALHSLGAGHQTVVDLRRLADPALVDDVARRLAAAPLDGEICRPLTANGRTLDQQLAAMSIDYLAPADARNTGLASHSIDYITSTNTLEHIPPRDIASILGECRRILTPEGVMSFQIDYQDHYAYFDTQIGVYNFLRYSDKAWRRYNGSLHYQNRLRHLEYLDLIQAAGFEVQSEELVGPTTDDLLHLNSIGIDARFADFTIEQLGIRQSLMILRPART